MKAILDVIRKLRTIYDKKQQIKFLFLFCLIVISGFLELVGISLILPFINVVMNPEIIMTNKFFNFFGFCVDCRIYIEKCVYADCLLFSIQNIL